MTTNDDDVINNLADAIFNGDNTTGPLRAFMAACRRPADHSGDATKKVADHLRDATKKVADHVADAGQKVEPAAGLTVEQVVEAIGTCQQWLCGDPPSPRKLCQVVSVLDVLDAIRALKPEPAPDPDAKLRELREVFAGSMSWMIHKEFLLAKIDQLLAGGGRHR